MEGGKNLLDPLADMDRGVLFEGGPNPLGHRSRYRSSYFRTVYVNGQNCSCE